MLPEHSGAFPALGLAGGLSQALLSWQSLLVLLVFSRSAGFTGSPDMCWWVVQAHRAREHCVALLVCSFLLSLVRLVLWEEDGHGGSAPGCSVDCQGDGLPVPVLSAQAAGASFCRKLHVCWAAMSHHFCGGDDTDVLHGPHFPRLISVFRGVITEDEANGPDLLL